MTLLKEETKAPIIHLAEDLLHMDKAYSVTNNAAIFYPIWISLLGLAYLFNDARSSSRELYSVEWLINDELERIHK
jgi:hypothetical protein